MTEETEKKESKIKPPELGRRYKKGAKIKGSQPPHGGGWSYDPQKDELTLVDEPTEKD